MKAFKYLVFLIFFISSSLYAAQYRVPGYPTGSSPTAACQNYIDFATNASIISISKISETEYSCSFYHHNSGYQREASVTVVYIQGSGPQEPEPEPEPEEKCKANTMPFSVKVPVDSGKMVCISGCQVSISKCVDVDFEAGMTCDGYYEGRECGTPPPTTTPTTPPVTQDPTNPTDKTEEQKTFENIMHVIGEKLDGIKDAITGGNQNQDGGDTGGSNGGTTGDVTVNVDMSETNAKIDETNSLIDELTKWLQGEDLGDDIFGDQEPPEKELTPQQFDTNIFSGRAQCPADARLSFNLLGGKTFTKTFEFKDWCDNLEIFGVLILAASYLYAAYIVSKA